MSLDSEKLYLIRDNSNDNVSNFHFIAPPPPPPQHHFVSCSTVFKISTATFIKLESLLFLTEHSQEFRVVNIAPIAPTFVTVAGTSSSPSLTISLPSKNTFKCKFNSIERDAIILR
ncbi:hypothetical protein R5R35_004242 [Gryllus longicercus]|uniref:Uncharacterized protein n=1 Tax=Gryllus longicercus TaxID=2509291 RepID=A0AAN9Z934_9ORTH